MLFVQLMVNGLQTGALYALIAAGFSLIFGMTRIFHAAHGATFTIAGFVFYECFSVLQWSWPLAVVVSAIAAGIFGVLLDRWVYAVIQRHEGSFFTVFVASFGAAIVVQNVISIVFGRGMVTVTTPLSKSIEVIPGLFVAPMAGVAILCAVVCFAILQYLLTRTNLGIALRALGENPNLVEVYGLTPRKLSQYVFLIGSVLVVPAAILTATTSGLNPSMGNHIMATRDGVWPSRHGQIKDQYVAEILRRQRNGVQLVKFVFIWFLLLRADEQCRRVDHCCVIFFVLFCDDVWCVQRVWLFFVENSKKQQNESGVVQW